MERMLRSPWLLVLHLLLIMGQAHASKDPWDGLMKKLINRHSLTLSASMETRPALKYYPRIVSFRGVLQIPASLQLTSGSGKVHATAAQLIFDQNMTCDYSPTSSNKQYVFKNCSDNSKVGDEVQVQSSVQLKLNQSSADYSTITAKIKILEVQDVQYGVVFPYIRPLEGQILVFNGEAWVPSDLEDLDLRGLQGDQGPVGPAGADGSNGAKGDKGDAGVAGAMGPQGPKGDKGDAGIAGATGPVGPAGTAGAMGPQGLKGDKGDKGDAGIAGATGPVGPAGTAGAMGPQGPVGEQGLIGPAGAAGTQGPQGVKGDKGDKGDAGMTKIAYLRDERNSGLVGGSCTAGLWMARTLNTMGGNTSYITLSDNRFTLTPGKYFIEVNAPAFGVGSTQAKVIVVETNDDLLPGSIGHSSTTSPTTTYSHIQGEIIVAETSTFEIQQRCATTRLNSGFGLPAAFGYKEVYTQVKIVKTE